jgi:hypothetical protein
MNLSLFEFKNSTLFKSGYSSRCISCSRVFIAKYRLTSNEYVKHVDISSNMYYKKVYESVLDDIITRERKNTLQFYISNDKIENIDEMLFRHIYAMYDVDIHKFDDSFSIYKLNEIDMMLSIYKFIQEYEDDKINEDDTDNDDYVPKVYEMNNYQLTRFKNSSFITEFRNFCKIVNKNEMFYTELNDMIDIRFPDMMLYCYNDIPYFMFDSSDNICLVKNIPDSFNKICYILRTEKTNYLFKQYDVSNNMNHLIIYNERVLPLNLLNKFLIISFILNKTQECTICYESKYKYGYNCNTCNNEVCSSCINNMIIHSTNEDIRCPICRTKY